MYYLWLMPNSPENEDNDNPVAVTSRFFNITHTSDAQEPASSSTQLSTTFLDPTGSTTAPPVSTAVIDGTRASGLSTGAKAGIGVGAALARLALIVVSFLPLRRVRERHRNQALSQPHPKVQVQALRAPLHRTPLPSYPKCRACLRS
ncbi:hypothetical protein F5Y08DRAFT_299374 [Xylaria arbuscula]|nr:hypothetical protein F5Y08DRAFT_299374 [Xylaria arbuscula]